MTEEDPKRRPSRETVGRRPLAYLPERPCLYIEVAVAQADMA
jgi:hypothetical protein